MYLCIGIGIDNSEIIKIHGRGDRIFLLPPLSWVNVEYIIN